MRASRPLVACQSARASRPASSISGSLIASLASFSSVAASTSILVGVVMDRLLLVDRQRWTRARSTGPQLPLGGRAGVTRQGGCGQFGLAGEEPEPGGPRIPRIDHRGAGDEVVQGAPFPLHEDAEEAQPEQQ